MPPPAWCCPPALHVRFALPVWRYSLSRMRRLVVLSFHSPILSCLPHAAQVFSMVAILVSVVISVDARMRLCIAAVILPERSPLALCPLNQPLMATLSRDDVFAVRHFTHSPAGYSTSIENEHGSLPCCRGTNDLRPFGS